MSQLAAVNIQPSVGM